MFIDNCGIDFAVNFNSVKFFRQREKTNGALTNVLMNSKNRIMVGRGSARSRRLKRILVHGDSYLCRKSSARFSSSMQADPISHRVLGNACSFRKELKAHRCGR